MKLQCGKCRHFKKCGEFYSDRSRARGLQWYCKSCRALVKKTPRHVKYRRTTHLRTTYGVFDFEIADLLRKQGGVCAICGTNKPGGKHGVFQIDHCHNSGRVRGLLCNACNLAIGALGDNPEMLERAINYLRTPPARGLLAEIES